MLACDLQLIDQAILDLLIQSYAKDHDPKPHILSDGTYLQPLAGIYPFRMLKKLRSLLENPAYQHQSIRKIISNFHPQIIQIEDKLKLTNFNTPDELERYRYLLPKHKLN